MVEILFRVKDKKDDSPSKAIEVQRMHRGDVVVSMPNGQTWSDREKTNPAWRIIQFSSMTVGEAEALTAGEPDPALTKLNKWKRIRKLDFDNILIGPGKFKDFLDDDSRATPVFKFTGNMTLIDSITITKANADSVVI